MKKGGEGGNKTITGLIFEKKIDISNIFRNLPGYKIEKTFDRTGVLIYYQDKIIARCFKKYEFYRFLESNKINWKETISSKLLPDNALLVLISNTLFIIEVKYQEVGGSVDEKLQTCDFKKRQYQKLVEPLKLKIEFVFVLNDWFKQRRYKDILEYVKDIGCHYFYNEIPLSFLGLPFVE